MKKSTDIRNNTQHETLDNLKLPEIVLPSRQKRLREALLKSAYAEKDKSIISIGQKTHKDIKRIQPKVWLIAASIALLLFSYAFYEAFFVMPQTVANITLQVNPAIRLSIGENNTIVEAAGLDEQGQLLLTGFDIKSLEVQEALKDITDKLRDSGLLGPDHRILAALTAVEDKINEYDLALLAQTVRNTLSRYLIEQDLLLDVKVTTLSKDLSDVILNAGLMPVHYVDLVDAVGSEMAARVLSLEKELSIDPQLFKEELDAVTSAVIDMTDAQISDDNIITALRSAMFADPELKMLPAIIDALIEPTEKGLGFEEALDLIQRALKADPTLEAFDDLLEPYGGEQQYETEDEKTDELEEAQYDYEQEDEQTESEQPRDADEEEADAPESDDPPDSQQPSDNDESEDELIKPYVDYEQYETEDEKTDELEEAQYDYEQEDEQTESEQPRDADKEEADAPESDDPPDSQQPSDNDESEDD